MASLRDCLHTLAQRMSLSDSSWLYRDCGCYGAASSECWKLGVVGGHTFVECSVEWGNPSSEVQGDMMHVTYWQSLVGGQDRASSR